MTKSRLDCIEMAHRRLGVLATDDTATADQERFAGAVLDALFEEVKAMQGLGFTWTTSTVPDAAFLPLSYLLAVEIAPHYEIPPRDNRAALIARLRTYGFPDDREDSKDLDDDGTVTDEEADAAARGQFY